MSSSTTPSSGTNAPTPVAKTADEEVGFDTLSIEQRHTFVTIITSLVRDAAMPILVRELGTDFVGQSFQALLETAYPNQEKRLLSSDHPRVLLPASLADGRPPLGRRSSTNGTAKPHTDLREEQSSQPAP